MVGRLSIGKKQPSDLLQFCDQLSNYIVDTHKKLLGEALLMSTTTYVFMEE